MSTVKVILAPLFPGRTFSDTDQAYVERSTAPIGPTGGQPRAIAQSLWPTETFLDTDLVVIETGRLLMGASQAIPGDVLLDEFNRAAGSPADPLAFETSPYVCNGIGSLMIPMSRTYGGPTFLNRRPILNNGVRVAWTNAASSGYATSGLMVGKAEDTVRFNIRMDASAGSIVCHDVVFGSDAAQVTTYTPATMKYWRIRVTDQVYYETSPDGITWTTRKTRPKQSWQAGSCVYSLNVGAWDDRGLTAGTTLVDRFLLGQ